MAPWRVSLMEWVERHEDFFGPAMTWVLGSRVNLGLVARILCFFVSLPVWINERPTRPDGWLRKFWLPEF